MTDVVSIEQIVREHKNVSPKRNREFWIELKEVERQSRRSQHTLTTHIQPNTHNKLYIFFFGLGLVGPLVCVTYLLCKRIIFNSIHAHTNYKWCEMCNVYCELISGVVCLHVQKTVYLFLFCFVFASTYECIEYVWSE